MPALGVAIHFDGGGASLSLLPSSFQTSFLSLHTFFFFVTIFAPQFSQNIMSHRHCLSFAYCVFFLIFNLAIAARLLSHLRPWLPPICPALIAARILPLCFFISLIRHWEFSRLVSLAGATDDCGTEFFRSLLAYSDSGACAGICAGMTLWQPRGRLVLRRWLSRCCLLRPFGVIGASELFLWCVSRLVTRYFSSAPRWVWLFGAVIFSDASFSYGACNLHCEFLLASGHLCPRSLQCLIVTCSRGHRKGRRFLIWSAVFDVTALHSDDLVHAITWGHVTASCLQCHDTTHSAYIINGQNYSSWAGSFENFLNAHSQLSHLMLAPPAVSDPTYVAWEAMDSAFLT